VDQVDHGDHDPPWWTRSVQDHLGPRFDISLMPYPSSPPSRSRPVARLQLQSTHLAGTLLLLYLTPPLQFLHGRTPRLRSVVVLHCLSGGSQHLEFMSNACNAATMLCGPHTPIVLVLLSVTLAFRSGYNNYLFCCWCLRQGFFC